MAGTRTMLGTGTATLALIHLADPAASPAPVLLATFAVAGSATAGRLLREVTGARLAVQALAALTIAICALVTVARG